VTPDCVDHHPYFTESFMFLGFMGMFLAVGVVVLAGLVGIVTRWLTPAGPLAAAGVLMLLVAYATARWGDGLVMRWAFGSDDWARLHQELEAHEADLAQYRRESAGLTTSQIVKSYLAAHHLPAFQSSKPNIPPLDFKVSDWRDTVPRVVVGFGCSNNVVFNSTTMTVEQSD